MNIDERYDLIIKILKENELCICSNNVNFFLPLDDEELKNKSKIDSVVSDIKKLNESGNEQSEERQK